MKVLIDTNVIIDVLCNRQNFVQASERVIKYCEVKSMDGYISALSVPNIVYILRKELTKDKVREIIDTLGLIFTIVDLTAKDLSKAAELDFDDYEDALQSVAAAKVKAEAIVTRNVRDYSASTVPAVTPSELLERLDFKSSICLYNEIRTGQF